jgi:hypothetical protein
MPVAAEAPPFPAAQTAPPGYPPAPGQSFPGAAPPEHKRNRGLIIGIVVGVVVILLMCCIVVAIAIPAFVSYQAKKNISTTQPATEPSAQESKEEPSATEPQATNPEPPASEMNPEPAAAVLSDLTAKQLVTDYLDKATAGQAAEAKALVTSKYLSRITSDYYDLAAKDLKKYEVVKVEQGQGGYLVFVKETWSSGVWTNWYLVVDKDGKLVIDDNGSARPAGGYSVSAAATDATGISRGGSGASGRLMRRAYP